MSAEPPASSIPVEEIDHRRLDDFAQGLAARPEKKIVEKVIWRVFADAFAHRPRAGESRLWLLAALQHAARAGIIRLPPESGLLWDRTLLPSLPKTVYRIAPPHPPKDEPWRNFAWHGRLSWVALLPRLTAEHERFLRRVHEGLVRKEFALAAPLKHRSLTLAGHEKQLGEWLKGSTLFGPGRLTLELLNCLDDVPPLAGEKVNDEPSILIFENSGPFQVAWREMRSLPTSPYGLVAYGSGRVFERSVKHLKNLSRPLERIHYVGDLDRPGLAIAQGASKAAVAVGLPAVEPATGVHRAMLSAAARLGFPNGWDYEGEKTLFAGHDEKLLEWLPTGVRASAASVLAARCRVPEEVLAPEELRALWRR